MYIGTARSLHRSECQGQVRDCLFPIIPKSKNEAYHKQHFVGFEASHCLSLCQSFRGCTRAVLALKQDPNGGRVSIIELVQQQKLRRQQDIQHETTEVALEPGVVNMVEAKHPSSVEDMDLCRIDNKQLIYDREEAKAVLTQFLKNNSLVPGLESRIANKAHSFVLHLVYVLHSRHRMRYLCGRELSTHEIRETLLSYLEDLQTEHGENTLNYILGFETSSKAAEKLFVNPFKALQKPQAVRDVKTVPRASLIYLESIGVNSEQVHSIVTRVPHLAGYNVDATMKPAVKLCLDLGVNPSEIPDIVLRRPQFFGCSVNFNLLPTVRYLESLGVKRDSWRKILMMFPHILTYSDQKICDNVNFLLESGITSEEVGRVLTKFPHIVGYGVESKLKKVVAYFESIGLVNIRSILLLYPQIFGLSVEENIKPSVEFLLDQGYSNKDVVLMLGRFPQILGLNVDGNIRRKWEFFVGTNRSKDELKYFPQYFGYSLENRIKPRYDIVVIQHGFHWWSLNRMLSSSEKVFQKKLEKDIKKPRKPQSSSCQTV